MLTFEISTCKENVNEESIQQHHQMNSNDVTYVKKFYLIIPEIKKKIIKIKDYYILSFSSFHCNLLLKLKFNQ